MPIIAMNREIGSLGKDVALGLEQALGMKIRPVPLCESVACPMRTDASSSALSTLWEAALEPRGARVRAHPRAGCIASARRARARCGSARSAMPQNCAPRGTRRIDPGA